MSLSQTPSGERIHIGFFGVRNAGKSSLVNAVTQQTLSVVSEVKGTTTDPVKKAMELLPLGPVLILDTPGLDDEGALGALRVEKTYEALRKTDLAVFVTEAGRALLPVEKAFLEELTKRGTPYVTVFHKADLCLDRSEKEGLYVSAKTGEGVEELKKRLAELGMTAQQKRPLVEDLLDPGQTAVLVVPIDKAAPKGRLILPQQQTIRALLDHGAMALISRDVELPTALASLSKAPRLVITDSQAFSQVSQLVPPEVPLTSFSILFARYKGDLAETVRGAAALRQIDDDDTILIAEGCTHHRQCDDIGTVKIPNLVRRFTGRNPKFVFTSGGEFPQDLTPFSLIIHCGGCMLNEKEVKYRFRCAKEQGVAITNYGIAIAFMHGILDRSLEPFGGLGAFLEGDSNEEETPLL